MLIAILQLLAALWIVTTLLMVLVVVCNVVVEKYREIQNRRNTDQFFNIIEGFHRDFRS